jgi:hypothetical protein
MPSSKTSRERDDAVGALFERAKNKDSVARKQHLVPASYLRRWAVSNQIRATVVTTRQTYITSPERAVKEHDFYSLASENLDSEEIPPGLFEVILSEVESKARPVIDKLIDGGPGILSMHDVLDFANYLTFQLVRGRAHRETLLALANQATQIMFGDLTASQIQQRFGQSGSDASP